MTTEKRTEIERSVCSKPNSLMAGLVDSEKLAEALGVRRETLSRMAGDPARGFPKGLRIGMAVYYNLATVRRWIAKETGAKVDHDE